MTLEEIQKAITDRLASIDSLWERTASPRREGWFSTESLLAIMLASDQLWTKRRITGEIRLEYTDETDTKKGASPDILIDEECGIPTHIGEVKLIVGENDSLTLLDNKDNGLVTQLLRWHSAYGEASCFGVVFLLSHAAFRPPGSPVVAALDQVIDSAIEWRKELVNDGWRKTFGEFNSEMQARLSEWEITFNNGARQLTEQTEQQLISSEIGVSDLDEGLRVELASGAFVPTTSDGVLDLVGHRGGPKENRMDAELGIEAHQEWAKKVCEERMNFASNGLKWLHPSGFLTVKDMENSDSAYGAGKAALSLAIIHF